MKNEIIKYLKIFFAITIFFAGIIFGIFYYYSQELPPLSELTDYEMKVGSEVFDRNDELIHIFSIERRKLTNLQELPTYLINGMMAVEDKNFRDHWGMDLKGLVRAFLINLKRVSFSQGASTITQQLARNLFLTKDKKITRKIKELVLAIRIEKHFSKDEILEMYFNKSLFGYGLYGIEVASQRYFDKSAKDVSVAEAALLIGMPQLPGAYNPLRYPERAIKRRNIVLKRMFIEGVISEDDYKIAVNSTLKLYQPKGNQGADDYFIEYIRRILERKYGTTQLFTGGLKIYTTLDKELQMYADSVLNKNLTKFENKNNYDVKYTDFPADTTNIKTEYVQAGVFSIEAETGYVRVMIGGRNFNHSKFNRIMQAKRQPGSSFKPIVYTTALVNGYTPATIIEDEPTYFMQNDTLFWHPSNYSKKNFGFTRMRDGLKKSRNIYATKMLYDVGPRKVVEFAKRFGISTRIYPYYTIAVGSIEVYPYEMISAYTTFANGGSRVKPIYIRKVEDADGTILEENFPEKIRVVNEQVAYLMANLMQSVIDEGTGQGVRWQSGYQDLKSLSYKWNAAGKTGTTDDFRDAWFIGYNKKLVTGIWVGFDDNTGLGKSQSGATAALPSWPYITKKAIEIDSPKDNRGKPIVNTASLEFQKPAGIVNMKISKETGLLPRNKFEETIEEIFIAGTTPTPLSDSLNYNFYPTIYRENENDSLVVDLGGKPYVWPDSVEYEFVLLDTTRRDSADFYPEISLQNEVDSLVYNLNGELYKLPNWVQKLTVVRDTANVDSFRFKFTPTVFHENQVDTLYYYLGGVEHLWPDSVIWREKHIPESLDLTGASFIKNKEYVTRPDSLLWLGPKWLHPDFLQNNADSLNSIDALMDSLLRAE
ncbi:MAG: PBP1A family penicillin-binding protein [Candidatus Cloacimonetes bacterium]|jgi:penicillin-binding protein 1A|nr:PBP1A family penicillin-binding protein [Candidatus Cloacimonadota bacterium]MBT6994596.1 PBP1A family penicillin-binding protein [Candidatus Cloacimonadota bacterium]